jgi:hypothetical protein
MKSHFTIHHKIQFWVGILATVASLVFTIVFMLMVKKNIPIHYDWNWNPTGYGHSGTILIVPLVMLPTNLLIVAIGYFMPPEAWNLPVKPKEGCEETLYRITAYMLSLIVLEDGLYSLILTIAAAYQIRPILQVVTYAYVIILIATCVIDIILCIVKNKPKNNTFEI